MRGSVMPYATERKLSSSSSVSYWDLFLGNFDKWICTGCGSEFLWARTRPGKRGGPKPRGLDPRYAFFNCWRGCRTKKGRQIARHELAPFAVQPKQDVRLIRRLYGEKPPKEYAQKN